jgi:uncharacterized protein (DUF433 family)
MVMIEAVLDRHIEITPGVRGGKPRITGTRITVADVVLMHWRLGISLEEIAGKYDLPLAAVYAAMSYYYDHQREIDQCIEEDKAFSESFRSNNPSLLQEKLKAPLNNLAATTDSLPRIRPASVTFPDWLLRRLEKDAAEIPDCTRADMVRLLIIFAYDVLTHFDLSPENISRDYRNRLISESSPLSPPAFTREMHDSAVLYQRHKGLSKVQARLRSWKDFLTTIGRGHGLNHIPSEEEEARMAEAEKKRRA